MSRPSRTGAASTGGGLTALIGARSVVSTLGGRATVRLGGRAFSVPDLPNAANRRWLAALDDYSSTLLNGLDEAGADTEEILTHLEARSDTMLDLLMAYDVGIAPDGSPMREGVLDREWVDEHATPREILYAVMEVWQAANPKVGMALAALEMSTTSRARTSSPSRSGAGRTTTSNTNSPRAN
jgi:hypothetical protein